jgi:hypothetical protein
VLAVQRTGQYSTLAPINASSVNVSEFAEADQKCRLSPERTSRATPLKMKLGAVSAGVESAILPVGRALSDNWLWESNTV